jgi:hypothetical protein
MAATADRFDMLKPTDPPILLAGLIAARRIGDRMLTVVFERQLKACGIEVRFLATRQEGRRE